ncbi:I12R2 protein, partial [Galbula dea]|nr:I12R2 protein [Galbula dea]
GSALSTTFPVHAHGRHIFTCKTFCGHRRKLVCGIDIQSGSPPDEPQNVSCIQHGTEGHPTCTWEKGRLTHISTTY